MKKFMVLSGILALLCLVLGIFLYLSHKNESLLTQDVASLTLRVGYIEKERDKALLTQSSLEILLASTTETKTLLESRIQNLAEDYASNLVTTSKLQARSTVDDELLKKYSKTFFLNENYKPAFLLEVNKQYTAGKTIRLIPIAHDRLESMLNKAQASGTPLHVISGYRSFDEQSGLKQAYKTKYGAGTANAFSADQGYSEHQLGTTVDLTIPGGGLTQSFDKTQEYAWLSLHAHEFGFIQSYPKGNDYYVYEPWHYRYVGRTLATFLYNTKQTFNDLDERVLMAYKDYWND